MSLRDRIGFEAGSTRLEDALEWAAANEFHYVDFNANRQPNHLGSWSDDRVRAVRETCERYDIHLGIHTSSAVNGAEFSPFVSEAVDEYLRANVNFAVRLCCEWIVIHAGYHFSSAVDERMSASLARLQRTVEYAERFKVRLLLENHNLEPNDAEVHYLAHNIEECRYYLDAISSEHLGWAFNLSHAHLVPEGIHGFLEVFGIDRIGEVRVSDNLGDKEGDLKPGKGNIDFASLFQRLESAGFRHHYILTWGSWQEELEIRDLFAASFGNE